MPSLQTSARQSWKPASALCWKQWHDGTLVFNALSGNTHLLNPTAAMVLRALEQRPANAVELAEQLASQIGVEADEELATQVETLLSNLDELGLIEPIS